MYEDYGIEREDEETFVLSRVKRDWCPEWLWKVYAFIQNECWPINYLFKPLKYILTKKV